MSDTAPTPANPSDPPPSRPLPEILAEAAARMAPYYAGYAFVFVGYPPAGDARDEFRVPCPRPAPPLPPPPPPADPKVESNAELILTVLDETDRPLTVVELAYRAIGTEPSGAFRKALRKLVRDRRAVESPGPPKTYELA